MRAFYTPTPKHEDFILEIGDTFTASPLATHRGEFLVMERYEQAGFCYYVCLAHRLAYDGAEIVFRNKDVDESTIKKEIKKSYLFSYIAGTMRRWEVYQAPDMENLFETKKKETKLKYPDSRAFMICSDQDSEEVRASWERLV
jgi:hypothetical protein